MEVQPWCFTTFHAVTCLVKQFCWNRSTVKLCSYGPGPVIETGALRQVRMGTECSKCASASETSDTRVCALHRCIDCDITRWGSFLGGTPNISTFACSLSTHKSTCCTGPDVLEIIISWTESPILFIRAAVVRKCMQSIRSHGWSPSSSSWEVTQTSTPEQKWCAKHTHLHTPDAVVWQNLTKRLNLQSFASRSVLSIVLAFRFMLLLSHWPE